MNLKLITQQVCDLAREVGSFVRSEVDMVKREDIETKGLHDYVTYVDKTSEKRIVKGLTNILPKSGFIVEEGTTDIKGQRYNWIVDPLDGTTNFLHHLPVFSISIALVDNNEVIMGVVFEINTRECFFAWKGEKAYLNDVQIVVSSTQSLNDSLIATGFPYADFSSLDNYLDVLRSFMKSTQGIRRFGSAAVDLAYVACGRFDAFFEYGLHPWDVAAGAYIVQQAGGKVSDFRGDSNYLFGKEIIASNRGVYEEFHNNISKYLG
ncbi:MAG: inositol monophosphatase [Bacteroidales bacterium]|nr:inositol monophosphatase [Bacteroidales bacterium]